MRLSDISEKRRASTTFSSAYLFVILFGIVSLLSDMTHEGARSITGPFLSGLGLSAAAVGTIAGFGELVGYTLRFAAGSVSDTSKRHWLVTGMGYAVNLLSVPLLALARNWQIAAVLMILERAGRAIRTPARDSMLSHATAVIGFGKGFGLHEVFDQIGATAGPLIIVAVLALGGSMRRAFGFLLIPALGALSILTFVRIEISEARDARGREKGKPQAGRPASPPGCTSSPRPSSRRACLDYPLIAYHLQKSDAFGGATIAIYYSVAMGADAAAALLFGRLYDKKGISALIFSTVVSLPFPLFAFLKLPAFPLIGVALWGIGIGAQESIMRAAIADFAPKDKRATAYGLFNAVYGVCWFAGSAAFGLIYDRSIVIAVVFSLALQVSSLPFLLLSARMVRK